MGTVVARNGRATTWSGEYELQLWDLDRIPRLRKNLPDLYNKDIEHLINELQLGNLNGKYTKRSCNCAMTGMSTTCLCRITQEPPLCRRIEERHHPQVRQRLLELVADGSQRHTHNHVTSRQASQRPRHLQDAHSGHQAANTRKASTHPPSSSVTPPCDGSRSKASHRKGP